MSWNINLESSLCITCASISMLYICDYRHVDFKFPCELMPMIHDQNLKMLCIGTLVLFIRYFLDIIIKVYFAGFNHMSYVVHN